MSGGFRDSDNILLLLGATNKPWEIDEAVFRPGGSTRRSISACRRGGARRSAEDASDGAAARSRFGSGGRARCASRVIRAAISGIIHDAKARALRRSVQAGGDPLIEGGDLEQALKTILRR
jgi:SpoVK/Ycf46/Vps4 family AAA+-type ATPase